MVNAGRIYTLSRWPNAATTKSLCSGVLERSSLSGPFKEQRTWEDLTLTKRFNMQAQCRAILRFGRKESERQEIDEVAPIRTEIPFNERTTTD